MSHQAIAPLRGVPLLDDKGIPTHRFMQWIETITGAVKPGDVQTKSSAYTLLTTDAGVTCDASSGNFAITLPDATKIKGHEYFVQNEGTSGTVTIGTFGTQKIGGSDAIITPAGIPYPAPHLKSDGVNWVLLGFIGEGTTLITEFWVTDTGENIVDENGEEILFAI